MKTIMATVMATIDYKDNFFHAYLNSIKKRTFRTHKQAEIYLLGQQTMARLHKRDFVIIKHNPVPPKYVKASDDWDEFFEAEFYLDTA